jgi:hypothetical protein
MRITRNKYEGAAGCRGKGSRLKISHRHSREGGNPFRAFALADKWISAFAGMTAERAGAMAGTICSLISTNTDHRA